VAASKACGRRRIPHRGPNDLLTAVRADTYRGRGDQPTHLLNTVRRRRTGRGASVPSQPSVGWRVRSDGVIELHQHDEGNAPVGVDKAEKSAEGVERLADHDAALDRDRYCGRHIWADEFLVYSAGPGGVKHGAEQEDVDPLDQERESVVDELGD